MRGLIEPSHEYDIWEAKQEEAYQRLIKGKRCRDCFNCNEPGKEFTNPEGIGWCEEASEFVYLDELVEGSGCESFDGWGD